MSKSTTSSSSQNPSIVQPTTSSKPIQATPIEPSTSTPSDLSAVESFAQYAAFKHYASLTFIFLAPALIAIPPRKLDFYTLGLVSAWTLSANQLISERSERKGVLRALEEGRTKRAQVGGDEGLWGERKSGHLAVEAEKMKEPFTRIRKEERNEPAAEVLEKKNVGDSSKMGEEGDDDYWELIKRQVKEVWRVDDTGEKKPKG